jgi:predicted PurR-regulated permease PerM
MKSDQVNQDRISFNPVVHYALQLTAIAVMLAWCFLILAPFITPLIWAAVLATTLYPLHEMLTRRLGGKNALSAVIITAGMLMTIIGPASWLVVSTVDEMKGLAEAYRAGELQIPPPDESVKSWPVIGAVTYGYWFEASTNLTAFIGKHSEQAKLLLLKIFGLLKNTGAGILIFAVSIVISGFLLGYAKPAGDFVKQLLIRIGGTVGEQMIESASVTIRNVAKGVLGVAVIQSILVGIGLVVAGIPLAGLWILVCLILAIIQVGIMPVSVGVIIYIWSHADTTTAVLLTIWMALVGVVDNILKPWLMGKGAPAPMLVVFLGAIGGFMVSGFIGLFTGAIVLTLGYNLMISWVRTTPAVDPEKEKETITPEVIEVE